jgi:ABC-type antimicrobial peptide transport system permease subunit
VELLALAILGLAVGLPLGARLNAFFAASYNTDNMEFRAYLPLWVHVTTLVIVLGLVFVSAWLGMRRLRSMDLAQATTTKE